MVVVAMPTNKVGNWALSCAYTHCILSGSCRWTCGSLKVGWGSLHVRCGSLYVGCGSSSERCGIPALTEFNHWRRGGKERDGRGGVYGMEEKEGKGV